MASLIEDLGVYLAANGIGTLGTNLFTTFIPEQPDMLVVVLGSAGFPPDVDVPQLRTPVVQIRTRAPDYTDANDLVERVFDLLHGKNNITIGLYRVLYCLAMQDPVHIGRDSQEREEFSLNFVLHVSKGE